MSRRAHMLTIFIATAASTVTLAGNAAACACCADAAHRLEQASVWREGEDSFERKEVGRLAFAKEAHLATGEADVEDIKGLKTTEISFDLDVARSPSTWTLRFAANGAEAGTLTFPADNLRFARLEVDPRPEPADDGRMVTVQKEWTLLTGGVKGTGMFQLGDPSALQLILLGSGNACSSADDFTHWIIRLTGHEHDIRFYGKLTPPAP